jgi:CRISPR-associated protein Cmr4
MKTAAFVIHALSPLHAGSGDSTGVIDVPIARMKATGLPFLPGTSIKGVLRDTRGLKADTRKVSSVFGPSSERAGDYAGAIVVGDARLLALPVRSFKGTFAWVTSPLLLFLARRDFFAAGQQQLGSLAIPAIAGRGVAVTSQSACVHDGRVFLEDIDLNVQSASDANAWAQALAPLASPEEDIFTRRFLIVDDDSMAFFSETATQVDARVRVDDRTRTVAPGALWLEESLPPETLLIGLLTADRSRSGDAMAPDAVLDFALLDEEIIQLGGGASTGRGRCRLIRVPTGTLKGANARG